MERYRYALLVRPEKTKAVKMYLETHNLLDKDVKIIQSKTFSNGGEARSMLITIRSASDSCEQRVLSDEAKDDFLRSNEIRIPDVPAREINIALVGLPISADPPIAESPLYRAVRMALRAWRVEVCADDMPQETSLLNALPRSYNIYTPMLLLPVHVFEDEEWKQVFRYLEANPAARNTFLSCLANAMGVTHIAINAPIPAKTERKDETAAGNVVRSPLHLQPLYGDFGPAQLPFPEYAPSRNDFDAAFWVSTRQNGIMQIWAPRYTMFSAGNVTEKARVLKLPSVAKAVDEGRRSGTESAAVDLFAGIGYFAFSYAKAGVSQVLCWDLNPWSVEGFRRGAQANKWSCRIMHNGAVSAGKWDSKAGALEKQDNVRTARQPETFLVFCDSNVHARDRIQEMRSSLPPIRHVNCGMLPTIGEAWKIAIEAIDPVEGGWLHLHETFHQKDVSSKTKAYLDLVQAHLDTLLHGDAQVAKAVVEDAVKVKSMGPRLWHYVLDIWIPPRAFPS